MKAILKFSSNDLVNLKNCPPENIFTLFFETESHGAGGGIDLYPSPQTAKAGASQLLIF